MARTRARRRRAADRNGKDIPGDAGDSKVARPTLVVTPTIDLLNQWYGLLKDAFQTEVGLLGGGSYDIQPLTVATYDSAYIHLERWGNKFGLLVCDECHHLPGPSYQMIAAGSIAPFRMGLTATPERADGQEILLTELLGPIVYRREITQLAGEFLAEYRTERVFVELSPAERESYLRNRDLFRQFAADHNISLGAGRLAEVHLPMPAIERGAASIQGLP